VLRVGGFAPRHLNRSTASFEMTSELLQAIENDDELKVREIISAGVDVNSEDDGG